MSKRDRTLMNPRVPMWKARDIIAGLGGVGGLTEKLIVRGFMPPGPDTVQGWATRNSIPGPWSPAVFAVALDEKLIASPFDALIRDAQEPLPSQVGR